MTEVFVDVSAASVDSGDAGLGGAGLTGSGTGPGVHAPADPEAVRALRYLADSGIRVVLVSSNGARPAPELTEVAADVLTSSPPRPRGQAWYLTSDINRCGGASARLKTVLIGGTPPSGSVRRCDSVARDLQTAAMEILAALAMPPAARA